MRSTIEELHLQAEAEARFRLAGKKENENPFRGAAEKLERALAQLRAEAEQHKKADAEAFVKDCAEHAAAKAVLVEKEAEAAKIIREHNEMLQKITPKLVKLHEAFRNDHADRHCASREIGFPINYRSEPLLSEIGGQPIQRKRDDGSIVDVWPEKLYSIVDKNDVADFKACTRLQHAKQEAQNATSKPRTTVKALEGKWPVLLLRETS